jgi:hypothetical protein
MENTWEFQEVIGTVGFFILIISIVLSLIWRKTLLKRAQIVHGQGRQYQELAAKTEEGQARIAEQLKALDDRLARIEAANASIEQTLKVVE